MRRVFTVSGWTLASRVLGLVRDRLWAGAMGGSLALDAFLLAFQLPNLLRNLFGEGALAAAMIPRYVQERDRDAAVAERFAGLVLTRLALGLSALSLVGMGIAAACVHFGAGRAVVVAAMTIPQVPFLIFICLAAIMSGILNGRRHFWVPAFAPVILNLSLIVTVGMGLDEECWALPYAVLAGGIANVALHVWALRSTGGVPPCIWRPLDDAERERLRDLNRAFLPTLIASGVYQINAWLDSIIAMIFVPGNGAVAILYFGARLLQFPMALVGHGVTTAAYPELASRAALGWAAAGDGIREAVRLLAYWLLPAAAGLLATAEPAVRTIYQVGSFDATSVARTVLVVQFLAIALIPMTLGKLLMRSFHAHRDQKTPLRIALWMVGCNLALNLVLVQTPLREAGLALSSAITGFGSCAAYLVALHRRGVAHVVDWRGLIRPTIAALAMAGLVWWFLHWWPQPAHRGSGYAALRLGAAVLLGAGAYLALAGRAWMQRPRKGSGA